MKKVTAKITKRQWEKIGRIAGWSEDDITLTEDRLVTFFDGESGEVLDKETFVITGGTESERFEKLEQEVEKHMANNFDNPLGIEWEDELLDVTG